jgi:hypothetical protein
LGSPRTATAPFAWPWRYPACHSPKCFGSRRSDHFSRNRQNRFQLRTHQHGSDFVRLADFDDIRTYIRYETAPRWSARMPVVVPFPNPILFDDTRQSRQTNGHLVTFDWNAGQMGFMGAGEFVQHYHVPHSNLPELQGNLASRHSSWPPLRYRTQDYRATLFIVTARAPLSMMRTKLRSNLHRRRVDKRRRRFPLVCFWSQFRPARRFPPSSDALSRATQDRFKIAFPFQPEGL